MIQRAAITGCAWRTPLGSDVALAIDRWLAGERAATASPGFDASGYRCKLGAPVPASPGRSRHGRFLPRLALLGHETAIEALGRSRCEAKPERLGVFAAVGGLRVAWDETLHALAGQGDDGADCWERGLSRLHPFWLLRHLSNNAQALVSVDASALGEGLCFGGANGGAQALQAAIRSLNCGALDAAVVLAYDSLLEPESLLELGAAGGTTAACPENLSAPYDVNALGCFPGEAAAALVLEPPDRARGRALGFLAASAVADGRSGRPSAQTVARCARTLTDEAEVVDGCGLADVSFDREERSALATLGRVLTSTPSAMGQLGAALPLVQAIALLECARRQVIPPVAGLRNPAGGPLRPIQSAERLAWKRCVAASAGSPGLAGAVLVEVP